jgi:hypothetical protein
MKLEEYKKDVYTFSEKASENIRKLTFAGIGIIWIFKTSEVNMPLFPQELFFPLLMLAITLFFDFFQYLIAYIIWRMFYRIHEMNETDSEKDIKAHPALSVPISFCFIAKVFSILIAYGGIIVFVIRKM